MSAVPPKNQQKQAENLVSLEVQVDNTRESFDASTHQHRRTFGALLQDVSALPHPLQSTESLFLAARLIEEAGYAMAQQTSGAQVAQLFSIAASLEREVERIVGIR